MAARELTAAQRESRNAIMLRLGIEPALSERLRIVLDSAIGEAERASPDGRAVVLDAGCGRNSPLTPFRARIHRFVGADVHKPDAPPAYLDDFVVSDLCGSRSAFVDESFDLILSNFTMEHFADPPAALANFFRWLRPDGSLVLTTVNRRHPFVAAYLGLPAPVRRPLQASIKASATDAHPLVGSCNDPTTIRNAMLTAGFERIELETVGHLARAWARRRPAFAIGAFGDVVAQRFPSRRSTIIAVGRRPAVSRTSRSPASKTGRATPPGIERPGPLPNRVV